MKIQWLIPTMPLFLTASLAAAEEGPSHEPLPESPFVEIAKLIGSEVEGGEEFGSTMHIDGDRLAVGVPKAPFLFARGAVYLFERDAGGDGAWGEVKKITHEFAITDWRFGSVISLRGDRLAAGACGAYGRGAVFLLERNAGGPGEWGRVAEIREPDEWEGWSFCAGKLEGDTLFVTQSLDFENGGAIYVFERNAGGPGNWGWVDKLVTSDGGSFGSSFSVDGDRFIAGAVRVDAGAGAAYVFERDENGRWQQRIRLTGDDPELDGFGAEAALDGETAAVAVSDFQRNSAVYVFERDAGGPGNWGQVAKLIAEDDDFNNFGVSIALEDDRLVVGAHRDNGPEGSSSGAVYVFERDAGGPGNWGQVAKLEASDREEHDNLGDEVVISGRSIIAGAPGEDEAGGLAGAAYVFETAARPQITATGSCPGEITLELSGASPSGSVFVVQSESEGAGIVPRGSCAGGGLGLAEPKLLTRFVTDGEGSRTEVRMAPAGACGRYLQAVDAYTCGAGPVAQIP